MSGVAPHAVRASTAAPISILPKENVSACTSCSRAHGAGLERDGSRKRIAQPRDDVRVVVPRCDVQHSCVDALFAVDSRVVPLHIGSRHYAR